MTFYAYHVRSSYLIIQGRTSISTFANFVIPIRTIFYAYVLCTKLNLSSPLRLGICRAQYHRYRHMKEPTSVNIRRGSEQSSSSLS